MKEHRDDDIRWSRKNKEGNRLVFLCPDCGRVHAHGVADGHRASHCNERQKGYVLETIEDEHVPGLLDQSNGLTANDNIRRAIKYVEGFAEYLEAVGADSPESLECIKRLQDAAKLIHPLIDSYEGHWSCLIEEASGFFLDPETGKEIKP